MSRQPLTVNQAIAALEKVKAKGHGDALIEYPVNGSLLLGGTDMSYVRVRGLRLVETSTDLLDDNEPVRRIVRMHG